MKKTRKLYFNSFDPHVEMRMQLSNNIEHIFFFESNVLIVRRLKWADHDGSHGANEYTRVQIN